MNNKYVHTLLEDFKESIWDKFLKSIDDYDLIQSNDKIAVCVSGGKDSMLTALCIRELQKKEIIPFDALYLSMDPGYSSPNIKQIQYNSELLDIPLKYFSTRIFDAVVNIDKNPCYMCARMRRGHLYKNAMDLGFNKIALGHHLDDVIETVVMGMICGSQIQTMMPKLHSEHFPGMQLIRPMYLVRENDIISWCRVNGLSFIQCACRFTEAYSTGTGESKRQDIKELLKNLRLIYPEIDMSIFTSIENVDMNTVTSYHLGSEYHNFLHTYETLKPTDICECKSFFLSGNL